MNKIQKAYAVAKADYDSAKESLEGYERQWLQNNGYDVTSLYHIEDDADFDAACAKYDSDPTAADLSKRLDAYSEILKIAENALIEMGLNLAPTGIQETLRKSKSIEVRNRLIDLAFRLDTKTVPKI